MPSNGRSMACFPASLNSFSSSGDLLICDFSDLLYLYRSSSTQSLTPVRCTNLRWKARPVFQRTECLGTPKGTSTLTSLSPGSTRKGSTGWRPWLSCCWCRLTHWKGAVKSGLSSDSCSFCRGVRCILSWPLGYVLV